MINAMSYADSQRFGNFYLPAEGSDAPQPTAFFPLTASTSSGSDIASYDGAMTQYGVVNGTTRYSARVRMRYTTSCRVVAFTRMLAQVDT